MFYYIGVDFSEQLYSTVERQSFDYLYSIHAVSVAKRNHS